MHELSIAMQLVETLETELASEGAINVLTVTIQVGVLTAVVPESLAFVWPVAAQNSLLAGSRLEILPANAQGFCPTCRTQRLITALLPFRCPVCDSSLEQITGGASLQILRVEVEDCPA